jgi:hypothetical protein
LPISRRLKLVSIWKNISGVPIAFVEDGPGSQQVVAPGERLILKDSEDYLVGTLIGFHQVSKIEQEASLPEPKAKPDDQKPKS